ncbi:hypothetical protein NDU88_005379 [Pleurodeles waltl]|uniref:Solute carrier organic anion transporter family member n=1 Tax=Pleurodeles waltl TaxID=8319 RepID=A0AAV7SLH3_PLEWA|nr:hypothetical protein NDU88_005379 [Pleurodeles waltl]
MTSKPVLSLSLIFSSAPLRRYKIKPLEYQYERQVTSSNNSSPSMSLCSANDSNENAPTLSKACESENESYMWVYVLMGNILRGIGETPIAPLGLSYLDDFAKPENSPLYIGFTHTVEVVGPLIGSLLASFCAQLYVDIGSVNLADVTLDLHDARWVGAWWLGYLVNGAVILLAVIPFCFLPKSLPKEGEEDTPKLLEKVKESKKKEMQQNQQSIAKDFLPFLRSLFRNSVYVLFLCVTIMQFLAYAGMMSFMPKYVEQLYGKSASEAIFLIAVYTLPVICIGYFLGGLMMKKFKISTFQAANIAFWTSVIEYAIFFLAFALVCKNSTVAGVTVSYESIPQVSNMGHLQSECNAECSCPTNVWDPSGRAATVEWCRSLRGHWEVAAKARAVGPQVADCWEAVWARVVSRKTTGGTGDIQAGGRPEVSQLRPTPRTDTWHRAVSGGMRSEEWEGVEWLPPQKDLPLS